MTNTSTKGQGSPRSHFYHVTPSRADNKWRVREVHSDKVSVYENKDEAVAKARELASQVENGHAVLHREDGTFESIE